MRNRERVLRESVGSLIEGFEDAGSFTATNLTPTDNLVYVKEGTQSVQLVSDAVSASPSLAKNLASSFVLGDSGTMTLWVYVEGDVATLEGLSAVRLLLWQASEGRAYLAVNVLLSKGWNLLLFPWRGGTGWTTLGSWDAANPVTRTDVILVKASGKTASVVTVYLDDLRHSVYTRPKCVLTWDDGRATNNTNLLPLMQSYGWKGTLYINPTTIGSGIYLSSAQLAEVYNAGWDISSHANTHTNLTTLSAEDAATEITTARDWLETAGYTRNNCHLHFAYPFNAYNVETRAAVEAAGIITARAGANLPQSTAVSRVWCLNSYAFDDYTIAQIQAVIDRAIAVGFTAIFYGHGVDGASLTKWQQALAYLHQKRRHIDVVTLSEWYEGL
jgi:peptidoglycan/xylan/chitin deacetylase (PgdA/CDA1 family)